jgi:hypothetical protein
MNRSNHIIVAECPARPPEQPVQAALVRKAKSNPLVAAMLRSHKGKRAMVVVHKTGFEEFSSAERRGLAQEFFSDEAICEVGSFFLVAFLTDDRQTAEKALKEAFKAASHLFRRDRERELLKQLLDCLFKIPERVHTPEKLKKVLEERCYHGQTLPRHRWNQISKALGLPNQATGSAATGYKHNRKRKPRRCR